MAGKHELLKSRKSDQVAYVRRIIVHEKFNAKTFDNDIALVQLDRDFKFNNYVRPICLASVDFPVGSTCVISGWGKTQGMTNSNLF
jgi:secreted trypsin-like serine protease